MRKVPLESRGALSLEVIAEAETLKFACECASWLHTSEDSKRERILTIAEEDAMRAALGKRIGEHCNILAPPIYVLEPQNAGTYLINWSLSSGPDGPRDYLSRQVANNPESIFELMKCFLSTGWGMTTGLPIETDLERNTYNTLTSLIAQETVAETLRSIYGDLLNNPQFHLSEREPRELRLANQFMFIYEKVAAEQQAKEAQAAGVTNGEVEPGAPGLDSETGESANSPATDQS
jgi:hypothetical protein